jgi:hypothetical protein
MASGPSDQSRRQRSGPRARHHCPSYRSVVIGTPWTAIRHRQSVLCCQQHVTEIAAKSPPDGYTLLIVVSTNAINATLYTNFNFSFGQDLIPVASIGPPPDDCCLRCILQ